MEDNKYTIEEITKYIGKDEIDKLCNNIYEKMMPLICKIAKPRLIIDWSFDETEITEYTCGSYAFPCFIFIYPSACIHSILDTLEDIEDSTHFLSIVLLLVIIHELSHATQDYSLLEIHDSSFTKDPYYREIVERDNNTRTFEFLDEYDDFIKDEIGINVKESVISDSNRYFLVLNELTKTRFISMVIETFVMREVDSDSEMGALSRYIHTLDDALTDAYYTFINLTINDKSIVLKSINDGVCKYVEPDQLTNWLLDNNFVTTLKDFNRYIESFNSADRKLDDGHRSIQIDIKMK